MVLRKASGAWLLWSLTCFYALLYAIEVAGWKYLLMEHATAPFFRCWERPPAMLLPEPGFLITAVIYSYISASIPNDLSYLRARLSVRSDNL